MSEVKNSVGKITKEINEVDDGIQEIVFTYFREAAENQDDDGEWNEEEAFPFEDEEISAKCYSHLPKQKWMIKSNLHDAYSDEKQGAFNSVVMTFQRYVEDHMAGKINIVENQMYAEQISRTLNDIYNMTIY